MLPNVGFVGLAVLVIPRSTLETAKAAGTTLKLSAAAAKDMKKKRETHRRGFGSTDFCIGTDGMN